MAARHEPQLEDAGDVRALADHDARLEVRRGQVHADAVDGGEHAERCVLVRDAVLQMQDRQRIARPRSVDLERGDLIEQPRRLLRLDREQQHVPGGEPELRDGRGHPRPHPEATVGPAHLEAAIADRLPVRASCDERHLVPVVGEQAADDPADRSRSDDDVPHPPPPVPARPLDSRAKWTSTIRRPP